MSLQLRRETALNLVLEGSVGSFNVGTGRAGQNSLEVKYFLTHVGLDFASGSDEEVLKHIAPVREIFDFEQLDFDEIMQRDIDDARVSSELVPYLLDSKSQDLIKLFPPIVVVVLPVKEQENRPASLYPKISVSESPEENGKEGKYTLRAGAIGREVFQFDQPIMDGERVQHDLVRFRLNTNRSRLVIVDGQHRAMALLALYRNLKDDWSDEKRAPFREYYAEWTPKYIREFELREINLPVIFCTFPALSEDYEGDFDLKKAARAIFLTLNKTARKVSNSRNTLLNDSDIIAFLLRRCLSQVKQKDIRSGFSFRIFNVELDQIEDRVGIQAPIALTGVNHIYYLIEHLLLNEDADVNGAKPRSGKLYKRKDLDGYGFMKRLNGRNLLGSASADSTKRDSFTASAASKLGESFNDRYGRFIVSVFERFLPYEAHNRAVLTLEESLGPLEDRKLRPILFEGQGINRVFETYRGNLEQRLRDNFFEAEVPKIQEVKQRFDDTASRINKAIRSFHAGRAANFLNDFRNKKILWDEQRPHNEIIKFLNMLYERVLKTVAFQTALICTFFGQIERYKLFLSSHESVNVDHAFDEYMGLLNGFFVPKTLSQFKNLVMVFRGELNENATDWKITPSSRTFRSVVYKGEMQPDQWPKYKYLILEIWRPKDSNLAESLTEERKKCRGQIFTGLYESYRDDYLREQTRNEGDLDREERNKIFDDAYGAFSGFLSFVCDDKDIPGKQDLKNVLKSGWDDARGEDEDEESWESVEEV